MFVSKARYEQMELDLTNRARLAEARELHFQRALEAMEVERTIAPNATVNRLLTRAKNALETAPKSLGDAGSIR